MKFTEGQWLTKAKHQLLSPVQVFDVKFDGTRLTVYAYTKQVDNRRWTLDQGIITVQLWAPMPDMISSKIVHYEGVCNRGPDFKCYSDEAFNPHFEDCEDECRYISGKLEAVIHKAPFAVDYYFDGQHITGSPLRAQANIINDKNEVFTREQLTLAVGEYVYGLGERFTAFPKNGQVIEMWNEDGGTASEIAYKNIPFYVTSKNYGIFVNHAEKVSFEVASEHVERVQFSVQGQKLEYTVIGGGSIGEVIANYNKLTGKPALPPAWSFGLWLSTSFTTNYDETTVNSFIDGMTERDIPLHVFHFDCFWMEACEWCNFEWDAKTFPDPRGMLNRLKEKGLKICVWINPYIAQKSSLFRDAMEQHYLVEYSNGDVWQWDRWQAGMGLVDFTNPDACAWYQSKLRALLNMGVDCFKTDFGERIPTDVVWHDGSDMLKMHNYYTQLYNKCVFDLLVQERGQGDAVLFARSATAGGQQFPVHWGGDCWGTYESMAESLRGGLSLCMSGFGFWSHDIGGFENTSTADLYKRWAAFGLLSTHSRLHGSSTYRVPWLFDDEAVDVLRHFTKLRCQLMPYLWSQAVITANTGIPMMRSMVMEFTDPACKHLDTQYMLGDSLMVAPIFNANGIAEYYLPKGKWINYFTGECKEGGTYYEDIHDYFSLPLYIRTNSIVPVGNNEHDVVYDYKDGVTFLITPIGDGMEAFCTIYGSNGDSSLGITVKRIGDKYSVKLTGTPCLVRLVFYCLDADKSIEGAKTCVYNSGLLLELYSGVNSIHVEGKLKYE